MPSLLRTPLAVLLAAAAVLRPYPALADEANPRVVHQGPDRVVSGARFESILSIDPLGFRVLSWSVSASLDGMRAVDITSSDTDFEQLAVDGFAEIQVSEDGSAFGSVGVLSFAGSTVLPEGPSSVLRSLQEVTRKEPGIARIQPSDGFPWPEGEPLSNQVLIQGGDTLVLLFDEAVVDVAGCSEVGLEAEGAAAEDGKPTLEVPRGATIAVHVVVRVPSVEHHQPSGLGAGVIHDSTVLALESVQWGPAVTDGFVKPDGFSRVDWTDTGFSIALLSSESEPSTWGEGTHTVATATYRFLGTDPPGATYEPRFTWADGEDLGGETVHTEFLPEEADPCRIDDWTLTVRVAPDEWIRGDSNGDGGVDISDAITTLGHLFLGAPASCEAGMEVNSDAKVDLTDAVYLLNHLFLAGPDPAAPYPECGWAPSSLGCERSACRP